MIMLLVLKFNFCKTNGFYFKYIPYMCVCTNAYTYVLLSNNWMSLYAVLSIVTGGV